VIRTDPRAGHREWIGLAVLTLPALLASMDLSVLFMAAPWLAADLAPTGPQLLWIMDAYGFLMAGLLLTMGALGDRIGRRRLLLAGATAFGAASVLAAYAPTAELLVLARGLLGVAGATLAPSTLALLRGMFVDPRQRRAAIGVWTGAFTGGIAVGPIVGGLLLEHFWWGSVLGFLAVQYLQVVLELRPFTAAVWQLPTVAATGIGIAGATTLVRWLRPAVLAGSALLVAAIGFLLVAQVEVDTAPAAMIAAYSVVTLGTGMLVPLAIDLIVGAVPPHRAGAAAGLGEAGSELGGALGIAVLGSIAAAVYRSQFVPGQLTPVATETVGGAIAAADALPDALADALIASAQRAFTAGFTTAATIMAALLAITAAVVTVRLGRS
jgi:DHA2 family multidrug resistance protein-like MFS transporter